MKNNIVLYLGRRFVKTETDSEIILTSEEKDESNKKTTLIFTKDKNLHNETTTTIKDMIKKSILSNYYQQA